MILTSARYVRDEIVDELLERMKEAIGEVEDEHEYITEHEIIIAGAKIWFETKEETDK